VGGAKVARVTVTEERRTGIREKEGKVKNQKKIKEENCKVPSLA
jgi:hypothetical protein